MTSEVAADHLVGSIGTWRFLLAQGVVLTFWMTLNATHVVRFDQSPFIILNLLLSIQAACTGPVILVSEKRHQRALHIKLDALIKAIDGIPNELAGLERQSMSDIEEYET